MKIIELEEFFEGNSTSLEIMELYEDYCEDKSKKTALNAVRKELMKTYGNENGMTLKQALEKYGSHDEIIKATTRSNPGMDACTGLYDIYHGGK